jgi:hypothetical protein
MTDKPTVIRNRVKPAVQGRVELRNSVFFPALFTCTLASQECRLVERVDSTKGVGVQQVYLDYVTKV